MDNYYNRRVEPSKRNREFVIFAPCCVCNNILTLAVVTEADHHYIVRMKNVPRDLKCLMNNELVIMQPHKMPNFGKADQAESNKEYENVQI